MVEIIKIVVLFGFMTLLGALGGFFFKESSKHVGKHKSLVINLMTNVYLYIGGTLYLFSAVINIWLLRFLDYTFVLPLTSLTYIWTLLISYKFLNEKIGKMKIFGIVSIMFGALLIGLSA